MRKYKIHYWITLDDDRWYDYKVRWWVTYKDRKGNCTLKQPCNTIKKLNKTLLRLYKEGYKGKVYIIRFLNYIKDKGHLTEEFYFDFNDNKN